MISTCLWISIHSKLIQTVRLRRVCLSLIFTVYSLELHPKQINKVHLDYGTSRNCITLYFSDFSSWLLFLRLRDSPASRRATMSSDVWRCLKFIDRGFWSIQSNQGNASALFNWWMIEICKSPFVVVLFLFPLLLFQEFNIILLLNLSDFILNLDEH